MIWNLFEFLRINFPSLLFTVNGLAEGEKIEQVVINDTGGTPEPWIKRTVFTFQLTFKFTSNAAGRKNSNDVYEFLRNRYGITILPAVTVDSVLYPEYEIARITPTQPPFYLGRDSEGQERYTFNIQIPATVLI